MDLNIFVWLYRYLYIYIYIYVYYKERERERERERGRQGGSQGEREREREREQNNQASEQTRNVKSDMEYRQPIRAQVDPFINQLEMSVFMYIKLNLNKPEQS